MSNRRNIATMAASAAGVLALVGGCGWPTAPTLSRPSATPAPSVPTCVAASLVPQVGEDQGTAGTQRFRVVLTNTGASTCAVVGYPVLVLRDAGGRVLAPAYPIGISGAVKLAAGRSATAVLTVTPAACDEAPLATTAAVSPPGSSYGTRLPVRVPVCQPTISPVVG
jgi:hypothetical protein